ARNLVGMSLITGPPLGDDGFFMVLLAPGRAETAAVRRDLVAVLDVSGSMSGDKLDQAKTALVQLLGTLRSGDRFRVVTFGSGVRRYTAGWTDVSADNVRAAQEWVRRLDTDGGTNIAGALTEAFAEPPAGGGLAGGDELVVFGRYRGAGREERSVTVIGRRGGHEERFSTAARFGSEQSGADYIQQLWAARKAGALSSEIRLHGPNPEIVSELKRLALRYGILTEYTSYLVQEPNVLARPMPLQPPAPEAQAGAGAVQRSREARKLASSLSLDAIVVTGAVGVADSLAAVPGGRSDRSQRIGGRLFVWRDSVRTDDPHGESIGVIAGVASQHKDLALV